MFNNNNINFAKMFSICCHMFYRRVIYLHLNSPFLRNNEEIENNNNEEIFYFPRLYNECFIF